MVKVIFQGSNRPRTESHISFYQSHPKATPSGLLYSLKPSSLGDRFPNAQPRGIKAVEGILP